MLTQEKPKPRASPTLPIPRAAPADLAHAKLAPPPTPVTLSSKKIFYNFLTYASTALIIRGMTVLITPITMRVITPADYGKMALLTSFAQVGSAIMGLGLRQVLALEYFHTPQDKRPELISTIILVYGLASIPLLLLACMLRKQISYFFICAGNSRLSNNY